jgi:ArsR family transcriptional regulator
MIDMIKALAEENRLEIVKLLVTGSLCVCELEEKLKIPQNLVSHHLSVLKKAGLVEDCRCGKNNYYTLNKQTINKLAKLLTKMVDKNEN